MLKIMFILLISSHASVVAAEVHVSPQGRDDAPGTAERPLKTLDAARRAVRGIAGPRHVRLHAGTHELPETLVLTPEDSGSRGQPLVFEAMPGAEAVISGGSRLTLDWRPAGDKVMKASVPEGFTTDQIFVDGRPLRMARYPNYDPRAQYYGGTAADAAEAGRAARWKDPAGGFLHAMHKHLWGDFHYRITGKDPRGAPTLEGGWQNNRRLGMHDQFRFVENIAEELDAPGEWFLDHAARTLSIIPPAGVNLARAKVEAVRLRHLVELRGTAASPVRYVTFKGLTFRHAARTFMDNKEPLLRSDWTVYRGGAIVFEGAEDCSVERCEIDGVGGNAVMVSGYNRRISIKTCNIHDVGGNGVAFVGEPRSVRSPLYEYGERQAIGAIDRAPGPKTPDYPADCEVDDSLIRATGRVEKQTAPVQIAMSRRITVRDCSIYDVPRAGINIGDGCWGGHLIEGCDVFDTVKETGDHGSFNSWGRDRYWGLEGVDLGTIAAGPDADLPLLDATSPVVIRGNRWRCDHGWDIDLDDGSSSYEIRENLCLNGGLKLREGFRRTVENNVIVNNSFHPHVWYPNSRDIFRRNIVLAPYEPILMKGRWGKQIDLNLLHRPGAASPAPAEVLQAQSGDDHASLVADARFIDPAAGDYRVAEGSPALALGFVNFPMDRFGVRSPSLRAIARTPELPVPGRIEGAQAGGRDGRVVEWREARTKNVVGPGEVSAAGLAGESGVLVLEARAGGRAAKGTLRVGDVIVACDGKPVVAVPDLVRLAHDGRGRVTLRVIRDQMPRELAVE
jgi:hypothetical protein